MVDCDTRSIGAFKRDISIDYVDLGIKCNSTMHFYIMLYELTSPGQRRIGHGHSFKLALQHQMFMSAPQTSLNLFFNEEISKNHRKKLLTQPFS